MVTRLVFSRRETKSGLIHAIGWRKSIPVRPGQGRMKGRSVLDPGFPCPSMPNSGHNYTITVLTTGFNYPTLWTLRRRTYPSGSYGREAAPILKTAPFCQTGPISGYFKNRFFPAYRKSGEFGKNGTMWRFPGPQQAQTGVFSSWYKIRANTRKWVAKVLINQGRAGQNERNSGIGSGGSFRIGWQGGFPDPRLHDLASCHEGSLLRKGRLY